MGWQRKQYDKNKNRKRKSKKAKSNNLDNFVENFSQISYGKSISEVTKKNECMTCNTPNLQFDDELSRNEYWISGLCMDCQNSTFTKD